MIEIMEVNAQEYDANHRLLISSVLSAIFGLGLAVWGVAADSTWTVAIGALLLIGGCGNALAFRRRMRQN